MLGPDDIQEDVESQDVVEVLRGGNLLKTVRADVHYGSQIGWFLHIQTNRLDILLALTPSEEGGYIARLDT